MGAIRDFVFGPERYSDPITFKIRTPEGLTVPAVIRFGQIGTPGHSETTVEFTFDVQKGSRKANALDKAFPRNRAYSRGHKAAAAALEILLKGTTLGPYNETQSSTGYNASFGLPQVSSEQRSGIRQRAVDKLKELKGVVPIDFKELSKPVDHTDFTVHAPIATAESASTSWTQRPDIPVTPTKPDVVQNNTMRLLAMMRKELPGHSEADYIRTLERLEIFKDGQAIV